VSASHGHVWSNRQQSSSDYNERTWQIGYRGHESGPYDFEGVVEEGYPLLEHIPDIDEPGSGYLWTDLARSHKTLYHFGEFHLDEVLPTIPAGAEGSADATAGRNAGKKSTTASTHSSAKGAPIPANYGGGTSEYPVEHSSDLPKRGDEARAGWGISIRSIRISTWSFPDQLRVNEFLTHFDRWNADLEGGTRHDAGVRDAAVARRSHGGDAPGVGQRRRLRSRDNDLAVGTRGGMR